MKKYLLSICIPTFNRKNSLKKMLDSINPNPHVEVVICDDGSNDNTSELIPLYKNKLNIKYIYQKNYGVSSAILKAYNNSKGEYVIKMDSDDLFTKDGLEFILKALNNNLEKKAFLFGVYAVKNKIHSKNIPPNGKVNFISVRADFKVKGDLKEVVKHKLITKVMYKNPKNIRRIPTSYLWYKLSEKIDCLPVHTKPVIKIEYSSDGMSKNLLPLKINNPKYVALTYKIAINNFSYNSIFYRIKFTILFYRYSFHNKTLKLEKYTDFPFFLLGYFFACFDILKLSIYKKNN